MSHVLVDFFVFLIHKKSYIFHTASIKIVELKLILVNLFNSIISKLFSIARSKVYLRSKNNKLFQATLSLVYQNT